ncbi:MULTISPECIES: arylamine N-acetyltransferase [unclassified Streptomyces]|uniref:arylamine N-acetyltransferase family protein n=1 Tax=unclassified Streptomyces TaxID=2593676 RepID=UPI0013A68B71|nr:MULTISPECIES: arylamine N-acetyltransferase [unclassified Streptomyces]
MNQLIAEYARRIGLDAPLEPTAECLRRLHEAHLYNVPFENFSMHGNAERGLGEEALHEAIVERGRGGICFETGRMMQWLFEACGFDYGIRLASGTDPHRTPATHQVFVVSFGEERWLFDIGYGARGPRGPILLADGARADHPALSARVRLESAAGTRLWTVSIKEHATNSAHWQDIYRFVDAPVDAIDLEMAHFYTTASPHSLLNRHKVASIPTPTGRVSVRDGNLTIVDDGKSSTLSAADDEELQELLERHFKLTIPVQDLGIGR